jgi:hypothetical protein
VNKTGELFSGIAIVSQDNYKISKSYNFLGGEKIGTFSSK